MIKKVLVSFIFMGIICISGCWNYREINDVNIVAGAAVDLNEDGTYLVTVEIIQAESKGGEPQMVPTVIGMEGRTLFEGVRNIITRSGKKLYWSHAQVLIISEEVARRGIVDILDWVTRDRELRPDISLLVSCAKTAREILKTKPRFESTVSYQIAKTLEQEKHVGKFVNFTLWQYLQKLQEESESPLVTTVCMINFEGETIPQVYGTAIFKQDRMVGWLDGEDVKIISWVIKPETLPLVVVPTNGVDITYEFLENSVEMKPFWKNDGLALHITHKSKVQLAELSRPKIDYFNEKTLKQMEEKLENAIEHRLEEIFDKLQRKYDVDVIGVGGVVKREMPDVWKKIKDDWYLIYPSMEIEVHAETEITEAQLLKKPIYLRD